MDHEPGERCQLERAAESWQLSYQLSCCALPAPSLLVSRP
jgi:hypothetical protein